LIGVVVGTFGCSPLTFREKEAEDAVGWEPIMKKQARPFLVRSLSVVIGAAIVFAASPSRSADPLSSLTPLDTSSLASSVTNNFSNNLINLQTSSNTGKISDTKISVGANGQLINGNINNNTVQSNQGLTSVMMNTGNNVNFNNSFLVNIIMPSALPAAAAH
jgi:hypothetical protein